MTIKFPAKPEESDRWAIFGANVGQERTDFGGIGPHYQLPVLRWVHLNSKLYGFTRDGLVQTIDESDSEGLAKAGIHR